MGHTTLTQRPSTDPAESPSVPIKTPDHGTTTKTEAKEQPTLRPARPPPSRPVNITHSSTTSTMQVSPNDITLSSAPSCLPPVSRFGLQSPPEKGCSLQPHARICPLPRATPGLHNPAAAGTRGRPMLAPERRAGWRERLRSAKRRGLDGGGGLGAEPDGGARRRASLGAVPPPSGAPTSAAGRSCPSQEGKKPSARVCVHPQENTSWVKAPRFGLMEERKTAPSSSPLRLPISCRPVFLVCRPFSLFFSPHPS